MISTSDCSWDSMLFQYIHGTRLKNRVNCRFNMISSGLIILTFMDNLVPSTLPPRSPGLGLDLCSLCMFGARLTRNLYVLIKFWEGLQELLWEAETT